MFGQPDVSSCCALPWSERVCQKVAKLHLMHETLTQMNYICAPLNKHIDVSFLLSCSNLAGKTAIHVVCPCISGSAAPSAAHVRLCLKGERIDGVEGDAQVLS